MMLGGGSIALRQEAIAVPPERVEFTFLDGSLDYDCNACGAACCRGHSFGGRVGEPFLTDEVRKALAFFTNKRTALPIVQNLPPACFFLEQSGNCSIHVKHGHAAKPETCKQFPFNVYMLAGEHLIVSPAADLCPLRVTLSTEKAAASDHESLLRALAEQGISGPVPRCADHGIAAMLEFERGCAPHLERLIQRGADPLALLDIYDRSREGWVAEVGDIGSRAATPRRLSQCKHIASALGLPVETLFADDPELARTLVAAAPLIRMTQLLRASSFPGDLVGRVDFASDFLLATYAVGRLARLSGMTSMTYQSVVRVSQQFRSLVYLLAQVHVPTGWATGERPDLMRSGALTRFQAPYLKILKSLMSGREFRPLSEVIHAEAPRSSEDRADFLSLLADRLVDRVSRRDPTTYRSDPGAIGIRVQRLAFSLLSERLIEAADLGRAQDP